jgi:hypothetical protein
MIISKSHVYMHFFDEKGAERKKVNLVLPYAMLIVEKFLVNAHNASTI